MTKRVGIAESISIGGLILIGLIGTYFGYLMLRQNFLVGLVPVVSSILLVMFGGLSLRANDMQNSEIAGSVEKPSRRSTAPMVMILLIVYLLVIDFVGFNLDAAALIVLVLVAAGVRRPTTFFFTLVTLLAVGVLFQNILGIDLPKGMF